MECAIGITGKDFVLLATDMTQIRSIVVLKEDEDKILELDDHKLMALSGPNPDLVAFSQYIQKNLDLYYFRDNIKLSTHATANFTRKELAEALRSNPYQVNILLGGWDSESGPSLYYMDYMANMSPVPHAVHGYASFFLSGLLDQYWKKDMTLPEALDILRKCIHELKTRFLVNTSKFMGKYVDKDGNHVLAL